MSYEPTMMPYPGTTVERPHPFTLYADGRAIYSDKAYASDHGTAVALRQAQLTQDQVDQLIAFALDEGGLATAKASYPATPLYPTDGDITIFELHAQGSDKIVSVYAPGEPDPADPDGAIRRKLGALAARLESFATAVADGSAEDVGGYEPEAYRVTLDQPLPDQSTSDAVDWPWPDLHPSDFLSVQAIQGRPRQLTAEQTRAVSENPLNAPNDLMVKGPDFYTYLIRIRALLPDEVVRTT
jgi:hypothetical protein